MFSLAAGRGAQGRRLAMAYKNINVETQGHVGVITLDRPEALNALNAELMTELAKALRGFEAESGIGAIVLAGGEKAFAAGADIKVMAEKTFPDTLMEDFAGTDWIAVSTCTKPVIAAVAGYALGGGCELAMMCDFILAAPNAKFGQPEIALGVIPGIGGSQRLTRLVGRAKAMEMILTGRSIGAEEAERAGLVARIVPEDSLLEEAIDAASRIAEMSAPAVRLARAAVNRAEETSLSEGLLFERTAFYALFATEDQKEGMSAFIEKRKAQFRNK